MRTWAIGAEAFGEKPLEFGGHRVLELLGLVVDLVPFHTEQLGKHAFDEVMAVEQAVGNAAAFLEQGDVAVFIHLNASVAFQPPQGHGDGRWGHGQPAGERGGDYGLAFRLSFGDRFQIIFFGNRYCQGVVYDSSETRACRLTKPE